MFLWTFASMSLLLCRSNNKGLVLVHSSTPSFCLSFAHLLITLYTCFNIPHPTIRHLSQCQCGHTIDGLGIHLLHCSCGNERIITHDTIWNTIVTIVLETGARIQKKGSHLFPHHTRKKMDIVITKDNFRTLMAWVFFSNSSSRCIVRIFGIN